MDQVKLEVKHEVIIDVNKDLQRLNITNHLHQKLKAIVYCKPEDDQQQKIQELYDYLKTLNNESDILFTEAYIVGYMGITQFLNEVVTPVIDYLHKAITTLDR